MKLLGDFNSAGLWSARTSPTNGVKWKLICPNKLLNDTFMDTHELIAFHFVKQMKNTRNFPNIIYLLV